MTIEWFGSASMEEVPKIRSRTGPIAEAEAAMLNFILYCIRAIYRGVRHIPRSGDVQHIGRKH